MFLIYLNFQGLKLESCRLGIRRGELKGKVAEQLKEAAKLFAQIGKILFRYLPFFNFFFFFFFFFFFSFIIF